MQITKSELMNVLEFVRPGVSAKEIVDQSTYVVFEKHSVSSFNDVVFAAAPLPDLDFVAVVLAAPFMDIVRRLPEGDLFLSVVDGKLKLKAKKTTLSINIIEEVSRDVSDLPGGLHWKRLPGNFVSSLYTCATTTAKTFANPVLTAIHLTGDVVEGCDNFRAARIRLVKDIFGEISILLPAKVLGLGNWNDYSFYKFAYTEGWFCMQTKDGKVTMCRTFPDGEYPEIAQLFDGIEGPEIKFPSAVKDTLLRMDTVVGASYNVTEGVVSIMVKDGHFVFRGQGEFGKIVEKLKCPDAPDVAVRFSVRPAALLDILKRTDVAIVGEDRILFADKDYQYVISRGVDDE